MIDISENKGTNVRNSAFRYSIRHIMVMQNQETTTKQDADNLQPYDKGQTKTMADARSHNKTGRASDHRLALARMKIMCTIKTQNDNFNRNTSKQINH